MAEQQLGCAHTGWLLDLYADPEDGLALWLLDEDGGRRRFRQDFPITFYAAGPIPRLRELWAHLQGHPVEMQLSRTARRDLFTPRPVTLLAIQVARPAAQPRLFPSSHASSRT